MRTMSCLPDSIILFILRISIYLIFCLFFGLFTLESGATGKLAFLLLHDFWAKEGLLLYIFYFYDVGVKSPS